MHPALSILFFTTLAGAGQGLVVCVALLTLAGVPMGAGYVSTALGVAEVLLIGGLVASFFHLGYKMRAWRAVLMWRTSWMSREVIVMPLFIALVALWWFVAWQRPDERHTALAWLALGGALLLWYCTAMIYACLRFIQEWAHRLTIWNFVLIGAASGGTWACVLATTQAQMPVIDWLAPWVFLFTFLAWAARWATLVRNAGLRPRSTVQTATGIQNARVRQISMGFTAGSFNTREFFHGASDWAVRRIKWIAMTGLFVLPLALQLLLSTHALPGVVWWIVLLAQSVGLLAERWLFFAQANHPQNIYYQTVA